MDRQWCRSPKPRRLDLGTRTAALALCPWLFACVPQQNPGHGQTAVVVEVPLAGAAQVRSLEQGELRGQWLGSYECGQGKTGLRLTLKPSGTGRVHGVFDFFPLAENPTVPRGRFLMTGSSRGRDILLKGAQWVYRPQYYLMVRLSGSVAPDAATLEGFVTTQGCTTFSLQKASPKLETAANAPPVQLLGRWQGEVSEGALRYQLDFSVEHLKAGMAAGKALYSGQLNCGAELNYLGTIEGVSLFYETINQGQDCANGRVEVVFSERTELQWRWFRDYESKAPEATATLVRVD